MQSNLNAPDNMPQCYRIHSEVAFVGKMVKTAKRKVTWKFAFHGDTGTFCVLLTFLNRFTRFVSNADDHAVVLVHTLNSGKKPSTSMGPLRLLRHK